MNSIKLQLIIITTTIKIKIWANRNIRGLIKPSICRSLWAKLGQLWINALPKVKIWASWSMEEKQLENVTQLRRNLTLSFTMSFSTSSVDKMDSLLASARLRKFTCLNRLLKRRLPFLTISKKQMDRWFILSWFTQLFRESSSASSRVSKKCHRYARMDQLIFSS